MTDQELFQALQTDGIIDAAVASRILEDAAMSGRPAEDLLYERRLGDEAAVARVKSTLTGAPVRTIDFAHFDASVLRLIPRETAVSYRLAPLELTRQMLVVGMLRPDDAAAQEALRFVAKQHGVSVGVYLLTPSDLNAIWRLYAPYISEIEAAVKEVGALGAMDDRVALEEGGSVEEAPIIKIVASTLRQAVEIGASDVHIEPQRSRVRIRFRVDGRLSEVASLPTNLAQPVISRVKVLARLKLDENRVPQDGRFRTVVMGRDIDYRVATFPTPLGEKVAIRVLDPTTGLRSFTQLGLSTVSSGLLMAALERPYGMILISGPTGSGKTTTLYAILQKLNRPAVNILSLEDPVEYFVEGVNQSQVKPEIGYDFSSGLRQILRQDPDIIMVGEIRDGETAGLAVNAALTGHIMLSTIHTNNVVGVIPRLIDLGVQPFLLSSALSLMFAQRLVLRLCPSCRVPVPVPAALTEIIADALQSLPPAAQAEAAPYRSPFSVYRAEPKATCATCGGKGTAGRVALFELLTMTRELADLVNGRATEGKIWDLARAQGIVTLRQDGILKALAGEVAIEEVLRETT
ncbi:MAG: GspE/PulE family protein [bacterium]|nr:GspE/PulE family protein [bacterium]